MDHASRGRFPHLHLGLSFRQRGRLGETLWFSFMVARHSRKLLLRLREMPCSGISMSIPRIARQLLPRRRDISALDSGNHATILSLCTLTWSKKECGTVSTKETMREKRVITLSLWFPHFWEVVVHAVIAGRVVHACVVTLLTQSAATLSNL